MDDGLTGADSEQEAIELQKQLQSLFLRGFLLRKWISSESNVLKHLPPDFNRIKCCLNEDNIQTLGVQWKANMDHFARGSVASAGACLAGLSKCATLSCPSFDNASLAVAMA